MVKKGLEDELESIKEGGDQTILEGGGDHLYIGFYKLHPLFLIMTWMCHMWEAIMNINGYFLMVLKVDHK